MPSWTESVTVNVSYTSVCRSPAFSVNVTYSFFPGHYGSALATIRASSALGIDVPADEVVHRQRPIAIEAEAARFDELAGGEDAGEEGAERRGTDVIGGPTVADA